MDDYNLEELLNRVYENLYENNPTNKENKLKMVMPIVVNKNRKTFIQNFKLICDRISRDKYEVKKFIDDELRCEIKSSLNDNDVMIINGFFRTNNIKKVLTNYIKTFVLCRECKSKNTELVKEDRILFIKCNTCKSQKSINQ